MGTLEQLTQNSVPAENRHGRRSAGLRLWIFLGLLCFAAPALLLSVPLTAAAMIDRLQIYPAIAPEDLAGAVQGAPAAIVILSAGRRRYAPEFGGETVDELSLERIRYGADLARKTRLPVLVSGGLGGPGRRPLADLFAETLSNDYGIRAQWREDRSSNTAENAIFSSAILKREGINRVVLVTHAWHMKRARAAFVANGMTVIPAPTAFYGHTSSAAWSDLIPSAMALRMSEFAIHETVGSEWYALHYGY